MSRQSELFPASQPERPDLKTLTRQNAAVRLPRENCPRCGNRGQFFLFDRGPHQGILCLKCGAEHPFRRYGVMWVPNQPP